MAKSDSKPKYLLDDPDIQEVQRAMEGMTTKQREFLIRVLERVAVDEGFAVRIMRELPIFGALVRAENYPALDRWFNRRTLEVIK